MVNQFTIEVTVSFEPNYSKHCYPSKDGDIIDSRIDNDPVVNKVYDYK